MRPKGAHERSVLHAMLGDKPSRCWLGVCALRARWIAVLLALGVALSGTARAGGAAGSSIAASGGAATVEWLCSTRETAEPSKKSTYWLGDWYRCSFSPKEGVLRLYAKTSRTGYTCSEVRPRGPLAPIDDEALRRAEESFATTAYLINSEYAMELPAGRVAQCAVKGILDSRPADLASMFTAAIQGMVHGLKDPWTLVLPGGERAYKKAIGPKHTVTFERAAPAKVEKVSRRSGLCGLLRPGDRVLDVDGTSDPAAICASFNDYEAQLQSVTVRRDGRKVTLDVAGRAAPRHMWGRLTHDGIVILRFYDLLNGTHEELKDTWDTLRQRAKDKGVALRGVLLDLRGTPGGHIAETEKVIGYLFGRQWDKPDIWPCHVVLYRKWGRKLERAECNRPIDRRASSAHTLPWAALTDGDTASAAEMLARLVQLRDRGPVIGESTLGKDKATCFLELANGLGLVFSHSFFGYLKTPANNRSERTKNGIIPACAVQPDVTAAAAKEAMKLEMKGAKVFDPLLQYGLQHLRQNTDP